MEELVDKLAEVRRRLAALLTELDPEDDLTRHIYRALGPLTDIERELRRRGDGEAKG